MFWPSIANCQQRAMVTPSHFRSVSEPYEEEICYLQWRHQNVHLQGVSYTGAHPCPFTGTPFFEKGIITDYIAPKYLDSYTVPFSCSSHIAARLSPEVTGNCFQFLVSSGYFELFSTKSSDFPNSFRNHSSIYKIRQGGFRSLMYQRMKSLSKGAKS